MIPVYLCEDEKEQLDYITKILKNMILMYSFDMEVVGSFLTPGQILASIKEKKSISALYFLDVDLKSNLNGIQLAEKIREYDPRAFIVFLTTHEEMALRTLEERVEPLGYIIKGRPDFISQVQSCLTNTIKKYSSPQNAVTDIISISHEDGVILIKKQDIILIKSTQKPHIITVQKENELITLRSSLKEISTQLDERFFRCYSSCIVNLTYVERVDKKTYTVHLFNGQSCPCSIRKYSILVKDLKKDK